MTPFFSIIIPTYNSTKIIRQNLDSLAEQTFTNFEVVVQDSEKSSDHLNLLLNEYSGLNIRYSKQKDKGIYDAMNIGIEKSRGAYLLFLGADDYLFESQTLASIHNHLEEESVDIVYGDTLLKEKNIVQKHDFSLEDLYFNTINHQAIFYKKEVFELENYNLNYPIAADQVLTKRLLMKYKRTSLYIDQTISHYSLNGTSSNLNDRNFVQELRNENTTLFPNLNRKRNITYSNNIYIQYLTSIINRKKYLSFARDYFFLIIQNRKPVYVRTLLKSLIKSFS